MRAPVSVLRLSRTRRPRGRGPILAGAIAIAVVVSVGAALALTRPADSSAGTTQVTLDPETLSALEQVAGSTGNVVVVTGAFPEPRVPPASRSLAPRVFQLHTSGYKNPRALPEGGVLIIGCGQSGVQIVEELLEAGRRVIMCIGKCPRVPRRYGDGTRPRVMPGRRLACSVVEGRKGPERLCWCQVPPAPGGNLRRQARKRAPPAVGTRARQAAPT